MKRWLRNTLAISLSLLVIAIFTVTCVCVYKFNWYGAPFWWTWFALVWLSDLFVGGYIFYKHNRTDETKAFWLLVMIVLPIVGAIIALIFNYKLKTEYGKPDNDHTKLQAMIFKAKKSIKIYTNSFFISKDTVNALNFARWKAVRIELIVSIQKTKTKQDLLIYQLQKALENKIELHMTNKQILESFIMIDDEDVIYTDKNFNFRNIYQYKAIKHSTKDIKRYQKTWETDIITSTLYPLERDQINPFKKAYLKFINIFSPFF